MRTECPSDCPIRPAGSGSHTVLKSRRLKLNAPRICISHTPASSGSSSSAQCRTACHLRPPQPCHPREQNIVVDAHRIAVRKHVYEIATNQTQLEGGARSNARTRSTVRARGAARKKELKGKRHRRRTRKCTNGNAIRLRKVKRQHAARPRAAQD